MARKDPEGCVKPARGPIVAQGPAPQAAPEVREATMTQARVGREAPDFEATAFVGGGFGNVRLSDFRGKWIVLCFYPGVFNYV